MSGTFFAVVGNCQARFVACVLSTIPGASAAGFTPLPQPMAFEGITAPAYPVESLAGTIERHRAAGRRIVLCEQTTPIAEKGARTAGLAVDQSIFFPNLECFAIWPYAKFDEQRAL